jgi:curli biogenesis system outer membrane secretion channel CsgG
MKVLWVTGFAAMLAVPAAAQAPQAAPKRTRVAVMSFDFGTITNRWWGDQDIGKGVADQIVDRLVNDGTVSVIERQKIDTVLAEQDFAHTDRAAPSAAESAKLGKVLGVRYIVAGSITKFGSETKNYGAGAMGAALGPIGMLGFKKAKTEVELTARLIDTTTGEIVVSAQGHGFSKKGGGVTVAAAKGMAGGAAATGSQGGENLALSEAQDIATTAVVKGLLEKLSQASSQ